MKKLILLFLLIFKIVQLSYAQNTIAKLKFEEAEEAYAAGNYDLALVKLTDVENLLHSTNPKILYLQILTQTKIIEKEPFKDFLIIESARNSINKYLIDYDNLPDNEDKYRDIYKISEKFKELNLPATNLEFDIKKQQIELNAEKKAIQQENRKKNAEQTFIDFEYFKHYKRGLTLAEAKIQQPEFFNKYSTYKYTDNPLMNRAYSSKNPEIGLTLYGENEKIVGCSGTIQGRIEDDANFTKGDKAVAVFVNDFTAKFDFSPKKTITPYNQSGYKYNHVVYSWEKNGKSVSIAYTQWYFSNGYTTEMSLTIFDNATDPKTASSAENTTAYQKEKFFKAKAAFKSQQITKSEYSTAIKEYNLYCKEEITRLKKSYRAKEITSDQYFAAVKELSLR